MTSRTLQLSLLALTLTCAMAGPVLAQGTPQYSFSPVKNWVPDNMKDGRFCTIRTEYNNGFVLQFASSKNGLDLLAVNFRQDVFEAGRTYNVTLTPQGGGASSFSAKVSKADQLKIAIGGNRGFYEAVKKASALDMRIEDNAFRFELGGFEDASRNLDQCIDGAPTPIAAEMKPVPVTPPAEKLMPAPPPQEPVISTRMSQDPFDTRPPQVMSENNRTARDEIFAKKQDTAQPLLPVDRAPPPAPVKAAPPPIDAPVVAEEIPVPVPQPAAMKNVAVNKEISKTTQTSAQMAPPVVSPVTSGAAPAPQQPAQAPKETIKWNAVPATKVQPEVQAVPPVSAAPVETAAIEPFKENAPVAPPIPRAEPKVEKIKSPEIKVNRESKSMEADFTKLESDFQRGGEGPSTKAQVEPVDIPDRFMPADAVKAPDERVVYRPDPEMAMKISELEQTVQRLKSENDMLDRDLKTNVTSARDEKASISGSNWDLERASLRYTEAEREIKRLGQKIQQERAQCDVEKQDLEAMLFDPRVTNEQQMAKLADLENKLTAAQQELSDQRMRYETRIQELEKR